MRLDTVRLYVLRATLPAVCAVWLGVWPAMAQPTRPRPHIRLPRAAGATPLSTIIEAEAKYLAAWGDLMESAAIARKINAEAVEQELKNWVDGVDAYFRRRELNRQWRQKEDPNYLGWLQRRRSVLDEMMKKQFHEVLRGDVTDEMNCLLTRLSGPALAYRYHLDGGAPDNWGIDGELPAENLSQIFLSDSGPAGSRLIFSAADPKVLEVKWPPALRGPDFNASRTRFQTTRHAALEEIGSKGQVTHETSEKLIGTLNRLLVLLETAYPRQRRREPADFLTYYSAKRYLRSLTAQVHRMIRTSDRALFDGSLRFQGGSVVDLVLHMDRMGLSFAKPPSGDKRVYVSLAKQMRRVWLFLGPDDPFAKAGQ